MSNLLRKSSFVLIVLGVLLIISVVESKHSNATDLQSRPPSTAGPIIGSSAFTVGKNVLEIQTYFGLSFIDGRFSPSWRRVSSGKDAVLLEIPVEIKYGLLENLDLRLAVPYLHKWVGIGNSGDQQAKSANFGGLGDVPVGFKYLIASESGLRPALSAQAFVTFPTGRHRRLNPDNLGADQLGDGAYTFTFGLNASKYVEPIKLHANLRYGTSTPARVNDVPIRARDFVRFILALEYPLSNGWVALLEGYSRWDVGPIIGPGSTERHAALVGILPGIEYVSNGRWEFELGVAIDLVGKNNDVKYTPIGTVIFKF